MLNQFVKTSITGWDTTQVCASLLSWMFFQKGKKALYPKWDVTAATSV